MTQLELRFGSDIDDIVERFRACMAAYGVSPGPHYPDAVAELRRDAARVKDESTRQSMLRTADRIEAYQKAGEPFAARTRRT